MISLKFRLSIHGIEFLQRSVLDNQAMVGQRSMDDLVRRSITSESPNESIYLDKNTRERILVLGNADQSRMMKSLEHFILNQILKKYINKWMKLTKFLLVGQRFP